MKTGVRPIVTFYLLAYAISWLVWSPYYLPLYPAAWAHMPWFHFAGTYGPLAAALICTRMFGTCTVQGDGAQRVQWRRRARYILIALLLPVAILLFSVIMVYRGNIAQFGWSKVWWNKELGTSTAVVWLGLNIGVYGIGEEAGWRGYALPWFQQRYGKLRASLMVAALWTLWHWPLFFYQYSGYYSMHWADAAGWLFSIVVGAMILTWLYNGSGGSVAVCAIFHGMMEIAFTTGTRAAEISQYSGMALTIIAIGAAFYSRKQKLDVQHQGRYAEVNDKARNIYQGGHKGGR